MAESKPQLQEAIQGAKTTEGGSSRAWAQYSRLISHCDKPVSPRLAIGMFRNTWGTIANISLKSSLSGLREHQGSGYAVINGWSHAGVSLGLCLVLHKCMKVSLTRISRGTATCRWCAEAPAAGRAPRGRRQVSQVPPQVRGPEAAGSGSAASCLPPHSARGRHSTGSPCTLSPARGEIRRWESVGWMEGGQLDRRRLEWWRRQRAAALSSRARQVCESLTCFTSILLVCPLTDRSRAAPPDCNSPPCSAVRYLSVRLGKTGGAMRKWKRYLAPRLPLS